jgi:hypothetical protein
MPRVIFLKTASASPLQGWLELKPIRLITLLSLVVFLVPYAFGHGPGYITPVGSVPGIALPNDFPLPPNFVAVNRI